MAEKRKLKTRTCPVGCTHNIESRMPMFIDCDINFDDVISREDMYKRLMFHFPFCMSCLQDSNSYLFPAYEDIDPVDIKVLADTYYEYYPLNHITPRFAVLWDNCIGMLYPDDIEFVEIHIPTLKADYYCYERDKEFFFDLTRKNEWETMINTILESIELKRQDVKLKSFY